MTEERHELDITIDAQGRVKVEVKGAKGPACMTYVEAFEKKIGRVTRKTVTPDYYEAPSGVGIVDTEKTRARRGTDA